MKSLPTTTDNTMFVVRYTFPNPAKGGTSQTPGTLAETAVINKKGKEKQAFLKNTTSFLQIEASNNFLPFRYIELTILF